MKNANSKNNSKQTTNSNCDLPGICRSESTPDPDKLDLQRHHLLQARYWICTIPESNWEPCLPNGVQHVRGQLECGDGGFRHWQCVVSFSSKKTLGQIRNIFGKNFGHFEPTRSAAANQYVWKLESRIGEYL